MIVQFPSGRRPMTALEKKPSTNSIHLQFTVHHRLIWNRFGLKTPGRAEKNDCGNPPRRPPHANPEQLGKIEPKLPRNCSRFGRRVTERKALAKINLHYVRVPYLNRSSKFKWVCACICNGTDFAHRNSSVHVSLAKRPWWRLAGRNFLSLGATRSWLCVSRANFRQQLSLLFGLVCK